MGKYRKLSHTVYHCNYHIVWVPKYRYKILEGALRDQLELDIRSLSQWKEVEIIELSIQKDHIHMVTSIPPKLSVSSYMGFLKGKTAIKIMKTYPMLKKRPYWGNHFWVRGYFVSTIGIDEEKIKRYVRYQEDEEKKQELDNSDFRLF